MLVTPSRLTPRLPCGMSLRMGHVVKLSLEPFLPHVLGISILLAACGGEVGNSPSNSRDAAAEASSIESCGEPLDLDSKVVFDDAHKIVGLGSDDAHPCSW